ncbi:MAG: hypothetical protein ACRD0Q_00305 [Acidimicrobiales bacterium]
MCTTADNDNIDATQVRVSSGATVWTTGGAAFSDFTQSEGEVPVPTWVLRPDEGNRVMTNATVDTRQAELETTVMRQAATISVLESRLAALGAQIGARWELDDDRALALAAARVRRKWRGLLGRARRQPSSMPEGVMVVRPTTVPVPCPSSRECGRPTVAGGARPHSRRADLTVSRDRILGEPSDGASPFEDQAHSWGHRPPVALISR